MTKEMIISSNGHETMVAILEEDLVAEVFVERERQRGVVGNVYKGRVSKVLPGTKGARLTSHVPMPGRCLVFMPMVDHVGVSRKIESRDERSRLRGIVREFRDQHGFTGGVIIRTAAAGRPKEDIVSDLEA